MTAGSFSKGERAPRYRKRRPLPALIMLTVLGLGAAIVWLRVATDEPKATGVFCAPGAPAVAASGETTQPTPAGQHVDQTGLDQTAPVPPEQVGIRVLNASTQRGEAAQVTEVLRQLGFDQVGPPGDDPVYPSRDMNCRSQIRFGAQGTAAARTVSMLDPCAELVRDERQDATIDLVVGQKFDELPIRAETRQILRGLSEWGAQHPAEAGGLQSVDGGPQVDPALIEAIRRAPC